MLMTFDMKVKAIKALAQHKGENPKMRLALELHKLAKKDCYTKYHLPYRCYYEYLKNRANNPSNKLMLNPCWPSPGYPIDSVLKVDKNDFEIPENESGSRPQEEVYCYENLKPETKELVNQIIERFTPWTNPFDTTWQRYYCKFLQGFDFNSFNCFDFFGASPVELEPTMGIIDEPQIEITRRVYTRLQERYNTSIPLYEYEDPESCEEYLYLYHDEPFILVRTKADVDGEIEAAKMLNKPLTPSQIEALYKRYGVE